MVGSKLKLLLKKIAVSLLICITLLGGITINTYANTSKLGISNFKLKESSITYESDIKTEKQKILLYSSHGGSESYEDGYTIIEATANLKTKLEKLGYVVEHKDSEFSKVKGYDYSYSSSKEMLLKEDLSEYALIIDVHRDYGVTKDTVKNSDGKDCAKVMFVHDKSSNNYNNAKSITDELKEGIKGYLDIVKKDYTYNSTSSKFNQNLDNDLILAEVGNVCNSKLEVQRSITYLSKSIDTYLKNK